jgi:hypothetical protein
MKQVGRHDLLLPLAAGLALAVGVRLLFSPYIAAALALALAFSLGLFLGRAPFRIAALLIAPVALGSSILLTDLTGMGLFWVALVNVTTALVLGLVASLGVLFRDTTGP